MKVWPVFADNGDGEYPSLEFIASSEEVANKWIDKRGSKAPFGPKFFTHEWKIDDPQMM